jgi:hypothetical protein
MRKLILLTLFATAISFAQQPGAAPASKAKVLRRVELDKLLATPDRVLLIDVADRTKLPQSGVFLSTSAFKLRTWTSISPKFRRIN